MKISTLIRYSALVVISIAISLQGVTASVSAADARTFQAGRIIDDGVFTNSNTMTASNIQSFFNSKVTCDTYGSKTSELGGGTRAQWLIAHGYSVPVTCLRDFYENPTTGENNYGKAIPTGAISAAQIIYNYSQMFNINPQVIIATLQKEQGLVTDEWPTVRQYSQALGFGCPDNVAPGAPACNPAYSSFSTQVYQAARHFRGFINNSPGWYVPFTTGINSIRWSPDANCGSGNVNIQNRSTVALYSYTPYQPNPAALNAQYGQGDSCSAHGNRNFFLYFTDWFGSTFGGDPVSSTLRLTSPITTTPSNPVAGQEVTISYTVKNFGSSDVVADNSLVQCRLNSLANCDSPTEGPITFTAGATRTITNTIIFSGGGNYSLTPFFFYAGLWSRYGVETPAQNSINVLAPDVRLISSISTSPIQPIIGQPTVVTYTVKNFSSQPAIYQDAVLQCRDEDGSNCDSSYAGSLTLGAGVSKTFTQTIIPSTDGRYTLTPYFMLNGTWYTYSVSQPSISIDVPDLRLTSNISVAPETPVPGQDMTITYTVKNFGAHTVNYSSLILQCRYGGAANCDPSAQAGSAIAAGASKTFTDTIPANKAGSFRLLPYFLLNGRWFEVAKGVASSNVKLIDVPRYMADMRIIDGVNITPTSPIPGDPVVVSFTVKNFGTLPGVYQDSVLQCRYNTYTNCDVGYTGSLAIDPGATRTFSYTITASAGSGAYTVTPYFMQNNEWRTYGTDVATTNKKTISILSYKPDLRLTGDIVISPSSPSPGQSVTVTYSLKNFGTRTVNYTTSVLQCRRNLVSNCDPGWDNGDSLDPGETKDFTTIINSPPSGSYRLLPYYLYNNQWFEFDKGVASSNIKTFVIP